MSIDPAAPAEQAADSTWQQMEEVLDAAGRLAKRDVSPRQFYGELLDRAVSALAAVGGAVWLHGSGGRLTLVCEVNLAGTRLAESQTNQQRHRQLLEHILTSGEAKLAPPFSGPWDENQAINPTEFVLVLCPVRDDREAVGVVELFQRPGSSPAAQQGLLRFLSALCESADEFHRQQQLGELRQKQTVWREIDRFALAAHRSLDLDATAYAVANEGRRVTGCDRLSVLLRDGARCRLLAVSGLDEVQRRSNLIRRIEELTAAVLLVGEPLWHLGAPAPLAPQIEQALDACLDESHARLLAVLPLSFEPRATDSPIAKGQAFAALVIERFDARTDDEGLPERAAAVAAHGAAALARAIEHRRVPLLPLWAALDKIRWFTSLRQLPRTILAGLALASLVAVLGLVPADFYIEARGELQPEHRREVFAPNDGVVSEIKVEHGDHVDQEALVLVLRRPELDFEISRVSGQLQTARKKLAAVQAARLGKVPTGTEARDRYQQLTAEEEETKQLAVSLEQEHQILVAQREQLQVRSPLSGQVLTWNVAQRLEARPVQRGQALLTVADPDGPWVLEARVADADMGHLLTAQEELGKHLQVTYVTATDPGIRYQAEVQRVSLAADVGEDSAATALVTASVRREQITSLRPGATVVAHFHCGRRSIGYVWLRKVFEFIQSRLLF